VIVYVLLATFAASELVMAGIADNASDSTQREQAQLFSWRYETVEASLSAESLLPHLARMNIRSLQSDPSGAAGYMSQAEADLRSIES
jgi:hypothetical protein